MVKKNLLKEKPINNNRGNIMLKKDKVLNLCVPFETKAVGEDEDFLITGHASTNDEDRMGDVIVSDAWHEPGALTNYLKNPVVLAFHDTSRPIGKTVSHEVDDKGLKITAKISKIANDMIELIKDGILSAFSIGFVIKEADFDPKSGVFFIKALELLEVSIVSVPANQSALFSVEKNFSNPEEYKEFRKQFIKSESKETLNMDKTKEKAESQSIDVVALAEEISSMVKNDLKVEEEAKKAKKEKEDKLAEQISVTAKTAAESLIEELQDRLLEKDKDLSEALVGIREQLKEVAENGEFQKALDSKNPDSKMKYVEDSASKFDRLTQNQKDGMLYAAKLRGIPVTETKTFKDFVKKSNMEHWDSGVTGEWESEYSTRIQDAMRERLVVEPLFTTIPMTTPTLNMPINPEAGDADWVHSAAYRSSRNPADETGAGSGATLVSTGAAVEHELDEQVLVAYKLATREYIGYEEEEDSIVALAPVINDAISRRMAKTADLAFLRGTGYLSNDASYDPILGLEGRGASTTDVLVAGGAGWGANYSEDDIVDLRRNLGLYGLDASALIFLVSHDLYYEIMKSTNFKTVDKYGPAATIHTGEVGKIFGVTVLVSQQFDNAAITTGTSGTTVGILCRPSNFLKGELRGITTEADRDIINQKRVIVSSRRFAFNDVISGEATINYQIES
jgi:HK97 family phage prohead protease/HK97 family phage major capsid protein